MRRLPIAVIAVLCSLAPSGWLQAKIGLSTRFGDAVIEKLELGRSYNIRELRGIPYTVSNVGDDQVEIRLEVRVPKTKELQDNYEPIPDPNWIRLSPTRHVIAPGGTAFSDIIISLPDDPKLQGRHFQAGIEAFTLGDGMFGTGVKSRLRFSVGPGPETLKAEKVRKAMVTLNFDIWPPALYVEGAKAGEKYDAHKEEEKAFLITNRASESLEAMFKSAPWRGEGNLPEDTIPAPTPEWLSFKPETLKIKPMSVAQAQPQLNIPKEYAGKKLAFLVQVVLPSGTVISETHRVFVTLKGTEEKR